MEGGCIIKCFLVPTRWSIRDLPAKTSDIKYLLYTLNLSINIIYNINTMQSVIRDLQKQLLSDH